MKLKRKKIRCMLTAAAIGISMVSRIQAGESVLLCKEDETFCIIRIDGQEYDSLVDEYDCYGNYLGSSRIYVRQEMDHGYIKYADTGTYTFDEVVEKSKDRLEELGFEREKMGKIWDGGPALGGEDSAVNLAVYARTETGLTVAYGEEIFEVSFPYEDLRPVVFNEDVTIGYKEDYQTPQERRFCIIENKTGNILYEKEVVQVYDFGLGEGYCTYRESEWNGEAWDKSRIRVIDYYGNELFETLSYYCKAWENGLIYLERGPYRGLVDLEGNWVFKVLEEEK